jgi:hypothetical protein
LDWRASLCSHSVVVGLCGAVIFIAEALIHGGFHFFALTLFVAAVVLAITKRRPVAHGERGTVGPTGAARRRGPTGW